MRGHEQHPQTRSGSPHNACISLVVIMNYGKAFIVSSNLIWNTQLQCGPRSRLTFVCMCVVYVRPSRLNVHDVMSGVDVCTCLGCIVYVVSMRWVTSTSDTHPRILKRILVTLFHHVAPKLYHKVTLQKINVKHQSASTRCCVSKYHDEKA